MNKPNWTPQISFRSMDHSDAIAAAVKRKAAKLSLFYNSILNCHVRIEARHRRHHQGNLYQVQVEVLLPGKKIVVSRDAELDHSHEDVYVAMRDAFNAMGRKIQDFVRTLPRQEKRHRERPPHGRVIRILRDDGGYGFIEDENGREVYFHRNSVLNSKFDTLQVGTGVRFAEEEGEEGPQASTVRVVGRGSRRAA